jgi:addiction module HigA family antidote
MTRLDPVHPGEVVKHDFMEPLGLSATTLAKAVGVTPARINEIVRGRRGITAETALRLARYFRTATSSRSRRGTRPNPSAQSVRTRWRERVRQASIL